MSSAQRDSAAERDVLGACILAPECMQAAADVLTAEDFYEPRNARVWEALQALSDAGEPIDTSSVRSRLEAAGKLQKAGGDEHLLSLTDTIPIVAHVEAKAARIRELATVRAVSEAALALASEASEPIEDIQDFLDRAEGVILRATDRRKTLSDPVHLSAAMTALFERMRMQAERGSVGHSTGMELVDRWLGGMVPGEVVVLAARPGMGKSALAQRIALGVSQSSGLPVYVASLEMPKEQWAMRMLASEGPILGQKLRDVKFHRDDWERARETAQRLDKHTIWIDDNSSLTILDVRRSARRLKRKHGGKLGLVVIDYLQLMRSHFRSDSREQTVAEISRLCKTLAKELDTPVLALSQLNRKCEERTDKRPQLGDLRESGSIEQDADVVAFVYRDEVYNSESPDAGVAEFIIAKQRQGPTGTLRIAFQKEYVRFENLVEREDEHWSTR